MKRRGSSKKEAFVGLSALAAAAIVAGATVLRPFTTSANVARVLQPLIRLVQTSRLYGYGGIVHKGIPYRWRM